MSITIATGSLVDLEVEGIRFSAREERYEDFIAGLEWARTIESDHYSGFAHRAYVLLRRIESWDGVVLQSGDAAPCDMKHKLALAGKRPDIVNKLLDRLGEMEEAESKN